MTSQDQQVVNQHSETNTSWISSDRAWVLAGLLFVALNLRPAIGSVLPILETIRADLGLNYAAASLLTTIPVVCMGVFAFVASPLARRLGRRRTVLWAVVLVGIATVARLGSENVIVLFATTVVLGIGVAISQTLLPAIVSDHFSGREAFVTGLYTASLIGGAGLAAGMTAFLANLFGTWPAALAFWAVLIIPAMATWVPVVNSDRFSSESEAVSSQRGLPWRSRWAWVLALYYGGAAALFFASLTWVAPRYATLGWNAEQSGLLTAVLIAGQLFGALGFAAVADRSSDRRPWHWLCLLAIAGGIGAVAFVPLVQPWLWAGVLGLGDGGIFALVLTLPVDYAPDAAAAGRLSSVVLGGGYLSGAMGPLVVGWILDVVGGYEIPFVLLIGVSVVMAIVVSRFRPEDTIEGV